MPTLSNYQNYRLTRGAGRVAFGCGAVTVNTRDLELVANFLDANPRISSKLVAAYSCVSYTGALISTDLQNIDVKNIKALTTVVSKSGGAIAMQAFNRLATAANGYRKAEQIAKIPAETLRAIAGIRKPRVTKKATK